MVGQVDHMEGNGKKHFSLHGQCGTYSAGDPIMSFSLGYGGVLTLAREGAHYLRECWVNKMEMLYHHGERIPKRILARCSCAAYMARVDEKQHVFDFK